MNTKKLLGKRIKELRKQQNLTQEKLAEMIDLETTSLSGIESGRHYPSLPTLEKIATHLSVDMETIFDFSHLQDKEDIKNEIIKRINNLEYEKLIFIYEFVRKFTNS